MWKDALKSSDRDFRSFAAISLLRSGGKAQVDMLIGMLGSETPDDIRITIIKAFQFEGDEAALDKLIALLSDPVAEVRHAAAEALGAMRSPAAIQRMASVLADNAKPSAVRAAMAEALGMTRDKDAIGPLVDVLAENDDALRKTASAALIGITHQRQLGDDPRKWKEWWDQNKNKTREQILEMVLGTMEFQLKTATSAFEALSEQFARMTIDGLNKRPDKNDPTALIQESKNVNPMVRSFVAQELSKIKSDAAFTALLGMLTDKSEEVRIAVAKALGEMGDKRAADGLIKMLSGDPEPLARAEAATALRKMLTPKAVEPLLGALNNPNVVVSSAAAAGLGELGDKRAVAPLITIVSDPKSPASTREAAAGALGTLGDRRAVQPLIATLTDPNDRLRWYAAMALGKLGNGEAVKPLCHVVISDPVPNVREAAAMSLGPLRNKEAVDALAKAVNDADLNVANAARDALFTIAGDDCEMLLQVGQILFAKPEHASAARIFEKLVQTYADKPEFAEEVWRARDLLAQCYAKTGDWKKARPLYEELLNREPGRVELRQGLAQAMVQNKEYVVAAKFYLDCLNQAPEQAQTWWEGLYNMLDEHYVEIGSKDVARVIADAETADPNLGGDAMRPKFLRLKAKAQQAK
jgi:HEAT repeat protein